MKADDIGLLVSESSDYPGAIGDQCANTCRWLLLLAIIRKPDQNGTEKCRAFVTDKGFVRSPDPRLPLTWRENDFSSDQAIPLFIAAKEYLAFGVYSLLNDKIKQSGWRTGNGDYANPILIGLLKNSKWVLNLALAGQALFLKCPVRWSDEKKRLAWEPNASADFLNWFHACAYSKSWALKLVSRDRFMLAVRRYLEAEPNSGWLFDLYEQASIIVYDGK